VEGTVDTEYYEDGIRYIRSEPYGLDNADEFYIYLPGAAISELPEEFLFWANIRMIADDSTYLDVYGIYNVGGEEGFLGTFGTFN
jgi:hypothetical protein